MDGSLDDDAALLLMARQVLGGPADEGRASYQVAITVCEACQRATQTGVGETEYAHAGETRRAVKATQTVPPAVRRAVLRRDQHRCQVPDCRHATFVDVHHIQPREEGGCHEPENLLTLCSAHHRACHRGALSIEGSAPTALRFRHADGATYGGAVSPNAADVQSRAFRALRALGFGEREARLALRRSATHVGQSAELEPLLRQAVGLLTAGAWARAS